MKLNLKLFLLPIACLAVFGLSRCGGSSTTSGSGVAMSSDSAGPVNSGGGGKPQMVMVAVIDSPHGVITMGSDSAGPVNSGGGGSPKMSMMYMIPSASGTIMVNQALYSNLTKNLGEKKAHQHTVFLLVGVNYDVSDSVGGGNTGTGGHNPPVPPKMVSVPNDLIDQLIGTKGSNQ